MYISGRERNILEHLLSAQEEVTVKELAEVLGVSERTIHRDLKTIENTLTAFHLKLSKKSGAGLRMEGKIEDKQELHLAITKEAATDFTSEERRVILLTTLLEMKEPVKLFTLAHELQVTTATISSDLDQLEGEIASFNLSIRRKKGAGIQIEGEEAQKRAALSNLISQYLNPFGLINQLKENIQKEQSKSISDRLIGLVNPEVLTMIEERVEQARTELPYDLADSGYTGLVVHLALAIERLRKGDVIQFDPNYLKKIEGSREYEIAKNIIEELKVSLEMDIPSDEIGYITMHLMGAKLRDNQTYLMEDTSIDIAYQAKKLIQFVSEQMNNDLTVNNKLLNDLTIHLKPAIFRLKQGMTIKNPMIKEIIRGYQDFFQIVQHGVKETFPELDFPDDEIGYLVLHFAATMLQRERKTDLRALVICSSGIGTSKILASKLMQKVPEIKSVENRSLFNLQEVGIEGYDLIVSTIPLKDYDGKYILTSPMLTDKETSQIQKEIRKQTLVPKRRKKVAEEKSNHQSLVNLQSIQVFTQTVLDLLDHLQVKEVNENQTIEHILESICMEPEQQKIITNKETVLAKLLEREKIGGLGIPDTSLSLHHTRSHAIEAPSFTIHTLQYPVTVQGMDGREMSVKRILLMLAPEKSNPEVLEILSFLSGLIIQDQQTIQLFEKENEKSIRGFLSDKFYGFIKEKFLS